MIVILLFSYPFWRKPEKKNRKKLSVQPNCLTGPIGFSIRTISLNSSSACIVTKSTKSAMPYVYVGKRNFYIGKTLWEIVGNLRNFGVGRILVRSKFERYPEVTYFRIVRADPLMDEVMAFVVYFDTLFVGWLNFRFILRRKISLEEFGSTRCFAANHPVKL